MKKKNPYQFFLISEACRLIRCSLQFSLSRMFEKFHNQYSCCRIIMPYHRSQCTLSIIIQLLSSSSQRIHFTKLRTQDLSFSSLLAGLPQVSNTDLLYYYFFWLSNANNLVRHCTYIRHSWFVTYCQFFFFSLFFNISDLATIKKSKLKENLDFTLLVI